jgi:hypothetical protein
MMMKVLYIYKTNNDRYAKALTSTKLIKRIYYVSGDGEKVELSSVIIELATNFDEQFDAAIKAQKARGE